MLGVVRATMEHREWLKLFRASQWPTDVFAANTMVMLGTRYIRRRIPPHVAITLTAISPAFRVDPRGHGFWPDLLVGKECQILAAINSPTEEG